VIVDVCSDAVSQEQIERESRAKNKIDPKDKTGDRSEGAEREQK